MATYIVPSGTTDLSSVASWASITDGDAVKFGNGNQTIDTGLTSLDTTSKNLNQIIVGLNFSGNIGGNGSPFIVNVSNGTGPKVVNQASGGALYIQPRSAGTITLVQQAGRGTTYLTGAGTFTTAQCSSGTIVVAAAQVVTNIYMNGGVITSGYNATAHTIAEIMGGTFKCQRAVTTLTASGNSTIILGRDDSSASQPALGTINAYGKGVTLILKGGDASGSTFTLRAGARIDMSQAIGDIAVGTLNWDQASKEASSITGPSGKIVASTEVIINPATETV